MSEPAKWSWRCFFGIHKWPNWSEPEAGTVVNFHGDSREVAMQKRTCLNCNRLEVRRIPTVS